MINVNVPEVSAICCYGTAIRRYGIVVGCYGTAIRCYGIVVRCYGTVLRCYGAAILAMEQQYISMD